MELGKKIKQLRKFSGMTQEQLARLREQEEIKRKEVVEAKKETSSIDKLKERKRFEYDKEVLKQDERLIEEFVTTRDAMARLNG